MTTSAAQELLQQACSSAGSWMHIAELAQVAGPGFCSLLAMTVSSVQAALASSEDNAAPIADRASSTAGADLEIIQEAAWEKLHTGCWKDVAPAWRDAYALACLLRALLRLSRLHASISAGNHLPCKAAIPQRQSRASEGACQPKNGQQGGEHAHSSGHMSSTKAWHVLLADEQQQEAAAQSCLSCAEEATSLQQDLQDTEPAHVQRRIYHEQECLESITGQQTRLSSDSSLGSDPIKAAMHELDLGIMMGGHAFQERLHAAIATAQSAWRERSGAGGTAAVTQSESRIGHLKIGIDQNGHLQREQGRKRKKLRHEADPVACVNSDENQHCTLRVVKQDSQPVAAWATSDISEEELHALVQQLPPGSLHSHGLFTEHLPSFDCFIESYMCSGTCGQPCRITGCMTQWPALERWQHPDYLLAVAGQRTVPVELGKHYLEEGWGQSLISLGDFVRRHVMQAGEVEMLSENSKASMAVEAAQAVGYLAQHPLFEQIPELAKDIREPEYCSLGEGVLHSVNAWFGPAGTVTPLHHDPHQNLLAQVVGLKYVRLYPPSATRRLYPYQEGLTTNASQVDLDAPNLSKYPAFEGLPHQDTLLRPGDMLYIPPGWWHYVQSLSVSFSVSFWWS